MKLKIGTLALLAMILIMGCKTEEQAECEINNNGTVEVVNNFSDPYSLEINDLNWGILEANGGRMTMDLAVGDYKLVLIQRTLIPSDEDAIVYTENVYIPACETVTWAP